MLLYNKEFGAYNASAQKQRRFAIHIELASGVDVWVVSHADVTPTGSPTVLQARISSLSNISQRLRPLEGRAEIGSLSFAANDRSQSLSEELRTELLTNSRGALGKTVKLYVGDARIGFDKYELQTTQVLRECKVARGGTEYRFSCSDIQRESRTDILDPVEARLTANVSDTDTTITVDSTADYPGVDHGASYSDAPSTAGVIYFRIDDEIVRTLKADATATQFQNCVRGVLGTRAEAHTTDEGAATSPDKGKKVREIVYLEMPVPKMIYALQTGVLYGQVGTLPDHWHAAMDASAVKVSDILSIGPDLYDPNDDTLGTSFRFVDPGKQDAKRFIEQELLRPLGLFQPVRADGQLGLRRLRRIVNGAAVVRAIDDSLLLEPPDITIAGEDIANEVELLWNEVDGELTRSVIVQDASSVARWGLRKRLTIESRGLHGSRQSGDIVVQILQQTFDRRSGPPLRTSAVVHGSQSALEIGELVRLTTLHAREWTGQSVTVDRPFEIQGMRTDWLRNRIILDLEASSQAGDPLAPLVDDTAIADGWFSGAGTNIAGVTGVVDQGSYLEVTSDITLSGASTLTASAAVFYAGKDLTIADGVVVTIEDNVQLRVLGTLTINGDIDGAANGLAGVADTFSTAGIPSYPETKNPVDVTFQSGQAGGFGSTQAHGGLIERVRQENEGSGFHGILQSVPAPVTEGAYDVLPMFQLRYEGGDVQGLPADLRGTSGGPGGLRYWEDSRPAPNQIQTNAGGTGGAGGAGLALITRGVAFGASGSIDTSGGDGSVGGYSGTNAQPAHAGGGAGGAPGGVLMIVDGKLNATPSSIGGKVIANYGAAPLPATDYSPLPRALVIDEKFFFGTTVPDDRFTVDRSVSSEVDATFAATRVQYMPPSVTPAEEQDDERLAAQQQISLAVVEAYGDVTDGALTRVTATVTEVDTDGSYSHANIWVRKDGTNAWYRLGAAEPSFSFDIPADNTTYRMVAVPVLVNGLEASFSARSNEVTVTVEDGSVSILWSAVSGAGKPEDNAQVNAAGTLSLEINRFLDGTADNGEAILTGVSAGAPDRTKDGFIFWQGAKVTIPRAPGGSWTVATGAARKLGHIVLDTTLSDPFTVASTAMSTAFARRDGTGWRYDNNGSWVSFTPTDAMVSLGPMDAGGDTIYGGALWGQPIRLVDAPEARAGIWSELLDDDGNRPAPGADVTATSGQPPSWLTSLISSSDINAGSVESSLNALNLVNGPDQAGADRTGDNTAGGVVGGGIFVGEALGAGDLTVSHSVSNNANGISFGLSSVLGDAKFVVYRKEAFGTINDHQWILGGDPDDYEVRFVEGSKSNMGRDGSYLSLNTWHNVAAMSGGEAGHRWRYTTGINQTGSLTGTLTFRRKSNTALTQSITVSLTLSDS